MLGFLLAPDEVALRAESRIIGRITEVSGEVQVKVLRANEAGRFIGKLWMPAKRGYHLSLDNDNTRELIRTFKGGRARIVCHYRHQGAVTHLLTLNLGEFSRVSVTEMYVDLDPNRPSGVEVVIARVRAMIELTRGAISSYIRNLGSQGGLTVRMGADTLASTRGAEFDVTHDPEAGYVNIAVKSGAVNLASPEDARVVKAGETAAMVHGRFLDQPLP